MKAILVVDEPKNCGECALSRIHYDDEHEELYYTCAFTEQKIATDEGVKCKHKDCPLRSLPSSLDWSTINQCTDTESFEYGRCCGRQELLDEILGN